MALNKRKFIAIVLAVCTVVLVGYSAYQANQTIADLERDVDYYQSAYERLSDKSEGFRQLMLASWYDFEQLIYEPDMSLRVASVDELWQQFGDVETTVHWGYELHQRLFAIAEAEYREERSELLMEMMIFFGLEEIAMAGSAGSVVSEDNVKILSVLVTALGAIGSGLLSFFTFVSGQGRRRIDLEMLALDLELKRIEVAKARFSAKDALADT